MSFGMREAGLSMRQVGFMCNYFLVLSIDDELLLLQYDSDTNRFVDVLKLDDDITGECKEIDVNVEERYTTKHFPRIYHIIYKIEFGDRSGYLLERYDGTSASSRFYPCFDYRSCRDYVETLEDL